MKFETPAEIDDATLAFPANVKHLMPSYNEIPDEFKNFTSPNKFIKLQQEWFFKGLDSNKIQAKKGIDKNKALRHLKAIQGSYEPKHEHKVGAVAYLMSLWFD